MSLRRGREEMRPRCGEGARVRWVIAEGFSGGVESSQRVKVGGFVMV